MIIGNNHIKSWYAKLLKEKTYDIESITGRKFEKKKGYRYLYKLACDKNVIRTAFYRMRRKKRSKRKDIRNAEKNLDEWIERMQRMIINTKPEGWKVDDRYSFHPSKRKPVRIIEQGKERTVIVPTIMELWLQHVIVLILEPILTRRSYIHSYSSIPGRGGHKGKKVILRWIKEENVKYFFQFDIRHFYNHVRVDRCIEKLGKIIRDTFFLHLIKVMYPSKRGLLLGFYLSPWMANFYLTEMDNLIKTCGIKCMIRYMDNITIFHGNKKKLHQLMDVIRTWLKKNFLKMKDDWQIGRFEYVLKNGKKVGRFISAMGWKFHRNKTILRKKIIIHLSRVVRKLYKRKLEHKKFYIRDCRRLMSLMGWIKHSDTYDWYLFYIKPYVNIRTIKQIVSKYDRKEKLLSN